MRTSNKSVPAEETAGDALRAAAHNDAHDDAPRARTVAGASATGEEAGAASGEESAAGASRAAAHDDAPRTHTAAAGDGEALAERLLAREREAVAPALNLLDDRRPAARAQGEVLVRRLEARDNSAPRIGLTGPPGVGKSTLADALVRRLLARGERVGILAVDPSSKRSGGALLGDRARVRAAGREAGVFFRSMAARDRLGGLSEGAYHAALVLAAVFDRVLVETVGIGQSESEAAELVDTLVFVAQPGAGDMLQFMKAGVLELPDLVVVNKADLGAEAERSAGDLRSGLGLGKGADDAAAHGGPPPVLLVSAQSGAGLTELEDALAAHYAHLLESGAIHERRRRRRRHFVLSALQNRYGSFGIEKLGGIEAAEARLAGAAADATGTELLGALAAEIEAALGGGGGAGEG